MGNLFAYRATEPANMMAAKDPVGDDNDIWLRKLAKEAEFIIAAWGNDGSYMGRSKLVLKLIPNLYCLKINKSGEPAHPLYQSANIRPIPLG